MFAVINKVYVQMFYISMVWSFIHSFIPFLNNKKTAIVFGLRVSFHSTVVISIIVGHTMFVVVAIG